MIKEVTMTKDLKPVTPASHAASNGHDDPTAVDASPGSLAQHANMTSDRTRRRLTGIGLGVPVLMTLISKPAFGAQCLSNMMSGNLSDPNRGNCSKGWSPVGWVNPRGMIGSYTTLDAWAKAGYEYGVLKSGGNATQAADYKGGSLFSLTGFTAPVGNLPKKTMRNVFLNYPGSIQFHLLAAWLNAKLGETDINYNYILTPTQVTGLASGALSIPPGYTNLQAFLESTYRA